MIFKSLSLENIIIESMSTNFDEYYYLFFISGFPNRVITLVQGSPRVNRDVISRDLRKQNEIQAAVTAYWVRKYSGNKNANGANNGIGWSVAKTSPMRKIMNWIMRNSCICFHIKWCVHAVIQKPSFKDVRNISIRLKIIPASCYKQILQTTLRTRRVSLSLCTFSFSEVFPLRSFSESKANGYET